ncbi:MAG: hypothetical protein LBC39_02550 [Methanobrevibacter sp.]|jgi:hypothetical protein|nr:hypothetical protein [Candidatus Methanovirga aequatorialis]
MEKKWEELYNIYCDNLDWTLDDLYNNCKTIHNIKNKKTFISKCDFRDIEPNRITEVKKRRRREREYEDSKRFLRLKPVFEVVTENIICDLSDPKGFEDKDVRSARNGYASYIQKVLPSLLSLETAIEKNMTYIDIEKMHIEKGESKILTALKKMEEDERSE